MSRLQVGLFVLAVSKIAGFRWKSPTLSPQTPPKTEPYILSKPRSCSSLALGEEQMDATNPATDPAELETQVNGSQTVTELIESLLGLRNMSCVGSSRSCTVLG